MLNDWTGGEESFAVGELIKEILHYGAEPSEESESRDLSPASFGRRSVMTC